MWLALRSPSPKRPISCLDVSSPWWQGVFYPFPRAEKDPGPRHQGPEPHLNPFAVSLQTHGSNKKRELREGPSPGWREVGHWLHREKESLDGKWDAQGS